MRGHIGSCIWLVSLIFADFGEFLFFMFNFFKKNISLFLVAGLGNPGSEYEYTRHNVGFMVLDYIAKIFKAKIDKIKFNSLYLKIQMSGVSVILLKPQTYMNASGGAVRECMEFYKIPLENLIVIFDDVSLDVGTLRIKKGGSSGGHNGIKSIINLVGSDSFKRIKIGVGSKPCGWELPDWVLSRFSVSELDCISACAEKALLATDLIVRGKIEQAMNKFN